MVTAAEGLPRLAVYADGDMSGYRVSRENVDSLSNLDL
jgi:hypothetical protein